MKVKHAIIVPVCLVFFWTSCTPRIEVAPPKKPITVNLNVKIDHQVRVKVDKDLNEEVFSEDAGLF